MAFRAMHFPWRASPKGHVVGRIRHGPSSFSWTSLPSALGEVGRQYDVGPRPIWRRRTHAELRELLEGIYDQLRVLFREEAAAGEEEEE